MDWMLRVDERVVLAPAAVAHAEPLARLAAAEREELATWLPELTALAEDPAAATAWLQRRMNETASRQGLTAAIIRDEAPGKRGRGSFSRDEVPELRAAGEIGGAAGEIGGAGSGIGSAGSGIGSAGSEIGNAGSGIGSAGSAELAGLIWTSKLDWNHRKTQLHFWLARQAAGQGLMTRCLATLLAYLFDEAGLHRATVRAPVTHPRVRPLVTRLGFVHEGVIRETTWLNGHWLDDDLFGLLEHEFPRGEQTA